ncbi:hypothetical protein AUJ77_02330 [Candidatus Nomurabacteria bacterium CG1_02_43_90]|uniref:Polymerase/histidinol phosphatase N-terminal domain-containing protein n=1 Tax=Candidatus Nomurabacteria bacterium CG1_02_43_90 TaxID=1805281 RepID=A0A1J4V8N4_9BACT|nr:MAG: hypothetical protein AUJ77_02330 [Candidatus Nomurabacteria bacterium CG1_02_43_90]
MPTIESLHTHTTLSDGKLTHREMFDLAESLNVSVIAFTDHDAVPPQKILDELDVLRDRTTKWVLGIELTTGLPQELAPDSSTLHMIGLFVDPKNEELIKHCDLAQVARVKRMKKMVGKLQELGFIITEEECLEASGGESVGRPHIVEALKRHTENNTIIEKLRKKMQEAGENDTLIRERYDLMMQKGEASYSYSLFLTPDAFKSAYFENDYMPTLDEGVALIRNAGGVALIAHYCYIRNKMPLTILEKLLAENRIDGVEVVYGMREYGTDREDSIEEEREILRAMAKKYGAITGGGSDAHSKEDLELYAERTWFSGETNGFTEKILTTGKVYKKFSSFV